ncbi:hypothetical protein [Billgrantia antri]
MNNGKSPRSVIKRIYVPTYVRELPNGERVTVPGHYRKPSAS